MDWAHPISSVTSLAPATAAGPAVAAPTAFICYFLCCCHCCLFCLSSTILSVLRVFHTIHPVSLLLGCDGMCWSVHSAPSPFSRIPLSVSRLLCLMADLDVCTYSRAARTTGPPLPTTAHNVQIRIPLHFWHDRLIQCQSCSVGPFTCYVSHIDVGHVMHCYRMMYMILAV